MREGTGRATKINGSDLYCEPPAILTSVAAAAATS